ncbi:MAG: helix-turn-helix domain-containing protein [Candidatus Binatia bacterium]
MPPRLETSFLRGLRLALATRRDMARGLHRSYRMVQAYERGERRVTAEVARALAGYLRERAARMLRVAEDLEAAAARDEGRRA